MTGLAPDVADLIDRIRAVDRPRLECLPLDSVRASTKPFLRMQGVRQPVAEVSERSTAGPAGSVPVRVYRPVARPRLPAIVYFHGGGWVFGDLEVADRPCRELANAVGAVVVSVDYRLAPEHPFPAGYEDCLETTRWVVANAGELDIDPARVAVGGDSAGANLAAAVAVGARDAGLGLAAQLLAYPMLDDDFDTESYAGNADNEVMPRSTLRWFWEQYSGSGRARKDLRALPLRCSYLTGVAPAFVATCEFDPLRDDGRAYADRLQADGVAVLHRDYAGLVHGGLWMLEATPSARALFEGLAGAARELLAG